MDPAAVCHPEEASRTRQSVIGEKSLARELTGTIGNPWRLRCQSGGGSHLGIILTKQIAGQEK
jgi:hypothetical protein